MHLEFFGAAGEVTGSCHILHVAGQRILLDCGMIQGGRKAEVRNREDFPFHPADLTAVVLSHAHIDHSGRLPLLVKRGYEGPIYAHNATGDFAWIMLEDSAQLGERDAERENRKRARKGLKPIEPLYTAADAEQACKQFERLRYGEPREVAEGVTVRFHDAGHIMGSCVVELNIREKGSEKTLVFSGDLGQYDTPILRDPDTIPAADLVVMESTYGDRFHRDRQHTIDELAEIISTASHQHGNILIPAFAVGRSQELLYQFGKHYDEWELGRWKIFLDSPMAIEATDVYWNYPHLYDEEATRLRRDHDEMPLLPNLLMSKSAEDSRKINRMDSGAIVIAGSGMCTGGRILHHFKHHIWRPETQVVIVGYQAHGSLGRRLVDGHDYIRIHHETIKVRAQIHTIGGLSAHGDQNDLNRWYSGIADHPPVCLVHGEPDAADAFQDRLERTGARWVQRATPGLTVDLNELEHRPGV
ncbi:MAG: MBL fold metallo-hydrolase [Gammaproteobacteria bacterium]|nr:MBL fold metallo-hydrolase [Gammaproteobacteria bacterium]